MFRLYGSPMSNYYNIVKLALMEKGLDFEEIPTAPSQTPEFLEKSPLGKIPVLEVREGFLTETGVIVDFLENVYPEIPLYPADPYQKALVKRISHMAEIYLDVPLRPVMGVIFSGGVLSDELKSSATAQLEKGLAGFARVARPAPWLAGSTYTAADIFAYYCLGLAAQIGQMQLGVDAFSLLPGFDQWRQAMSAREFVAQVDAAQKKAIEAFYASKKG